MRPSFPSSSDRSTNQARSMATSPANRRRVRWRQRYFRPAWLTGYKRVRLVGCSQVVGPLWRTGWSAFAQNTSPRSRRATLSFLWSRKTAHAHHVVSWVIVVLTVEASGRQESGQASRQAGRQAGCRFSADRLLLHRRSARQKKKKKKRALNIAVFCADFARLRLVSGVTGVIGARYVEWRDGVPWDGGTDGGAAWSKERRQSYREWIFAYSRERLLCNRCSAERSVCALT